MSESEKSAESESAAEEVKAAAGEAKTADDGKSRTSNDDEGISVEEFWGENVGEIDEEDTTPSYGIPRLETGSGAPASAAKPETAKAEPAEAETTTAEPAEAETTKAESEPPQIADAKSPPGNKGETGELLITASGLCKYYGNFKAIEDVSFQVRRGQVVAFLGPNGAGKSTTMKILTGVIAPDKGHAEIAGLSVFDDRLTIAHKLGYLPENGPLYNEMTPLTLLRFLGEARGLDADRIAHRIETLKDRLHLETVLGKPIHKLSRGYRQRVGLAQALLHEPDVLIMDEPTAGLDPNQIQDVRRIISEFGQDKAVLLSTHILQEVEAIADRVVFIHQGEIVFNGTVDELRAAGKGLEQAFASHTGYTNASWANT